MAQQSNLIIPTRGIKFNSRRIPQPQFIRPIPNFTQYVDDMSPHQRKFVISTHGLVEEFNVRDREEVEAIRKFLIEDTNVWKQGKIPSYCFYSIDAATAYHTFMELIELVHEGFHSYGFGDLERRFLCTQIESLTDIFYASIPTINNLTFMEQSQFRQEFHQLESYREALINTAEFYTSLSNIIQLPDETSNLSRIVPNSFSTPDITPSIKPSRLSQLAQSGIPTTISSAKCSGVQQPIADKSSDEMSVDNTIVNQPSMSTNLNVSQPSIMTTTEEYSNNLYLPRFQQPTIPNPTNNADGNIPNMRYNHSDIENSSHASNLNKIRDNHPCDNIYRHVPLNNSSNNIKSINFDTSELLSASKSLHLREIHHSELNEQLNIETGSDDTNFDVLDWNYPLKHANQQALVSQESKLLKIINMINSNTNQTIKDVKEPVSLKDERDRRLKFPKPKQI